MWEGHGKGPPPPSPSTKPVYRSNDYRPDPGPSRLQGGHAMQVTPSKQKQHHGGVPTSSPSNGFASASYRRPIQDDRQTGSPYSRPGSTTPQQTVSPRQGRTLFSTDSFGRRGSRSRSRSQRRSSSEQLAGGRTMVVHCDCVLEGYKDGVGFPSQILEMIPQLGKSLTAPWDKPPQKRAIAVKSPSRQKLKTASFPKVIGQLTEVLDTEKSYNLKLHALVKHYYLPLLNFALSGHAIIDRQHVQAIFGNLEDIARLSDAFFAMLTTDVFDGGYLDENRLAMGCWGERVLALLKSMEEAYRLWMSNTTLRDTVREELLRKEAKGKDRMFTDFLKNTELSSKDETRRTGGFSELIMEPTQRLPRLQMMIRSIIDHLPGSNNNVPHLEEAIAIIADICSMQVHPQTKRFLELWAVERAIEGFPKDVLSSEDCRFVGCLDVVDVLDEDEQLPCTLFLFNDRLVITKRPPYADRSGKELAGLNDLDNLHRLYARELVGASTSQQSLAIGGKLDSVPPPIKPNAFSYRGTVDLSNLAMIDFGGSAFGMKLHQAPKGSLGSAKWLERHGRSYITDNTYPSDVRKLEKELFLSNFADAKALHGSIGLVVKGVPIPVEPEGGGATDHLVMYFRVVPTETYVYSDMKAIDSDRTDVDSHRKSDFALHLVAEVDEAKSNLSFVTADGKTQPKTIFRAQFTSDTTCDLTMRLASNPQHVSSTTIPASQIVATVGITAWESEKAEFQHELSRPSTPSGGKRPLSWLKNSFGRSTNRASSGNSQASMASAYTTSSTAADRTLETVGTNRGKFAELLRSAPRLATRPKSAIELRVNNMLSSRESGMLGDGDESFEVLVDDHELDVPLNRRNRRRRSSLPGPPPSRLSPEVQMRPRPQSMVKPQLDYSRMVDQSPTEPLRPREITPSPTHGGLRGPRDQLSPSPTQAHLSGPRDLGGQGRARQLARKPPPAVEEDTVIDHGFEDADEPDFHMTGMRRDSTSSKRLHEELEKEEPPPLPVRHPKKAAIVPGSQGRQPSPDQQRKRSAGQGQRAAVNGLRSASGKTVRPTSALTDRLRQMAPPTVEQQAQDDMDDDDDETMRDLEDNDALLPPLERLRQPLSAVRRLVRDAVAGQQKENDNPHRLERQTTLTRSPAVYDITQDLHRGKSAGRSARATVPLSAVVPLLQRVEDYVAHAEGQIAQHRETEKALEAKSDILGQELADRQVACGDLEAALKKERRDHAETHADVEQLIQAAEDDVVSFEQQLQAIANMEAFSNDRKVREAMSRMVDALQERNRAQEELARYKRFTEEQLREKKTWQRILEDNGLIGRYE